MQCSKDDGYTSSFRTLIIPCLTGFEKLALSQFKVYIETETMTNVFKDLYKVPPSDDWLPYEYIDAKVKKKIDKTKR